MSVKGDVPARGVALAIAETGGEPRSDGRELAFPISPSNDTTSRSDSAKSKHQYPRQSRRHREHRPFGTPLVIRPHPNPLPGGEGERGASARYEPARWMAWVF